MERFKARIVAGIVTDIIVVDAANHGFFDGVLIPEGLPIEVGWLHDGAVFTAPPAPPKTAEELAKESTFAVREAEAASTKADAIVQYLITHTPAECAAYVQSNVTNLTTSVSFLSKVAMVLSVLAKDRLK